MKPDSKTEPDEDFWDLGDDDLDLNTPGHEASVELDHEPTAEASEADEPIANKEEDSLELKDSLALRKEEIGEDIDLLLDDEKLSSAELSANESKTNTDEQEGRNKVSDKASLSGGKTPITKLEKGSLVALILLLIGATALGLSTFYDHAPEGTLMVFDQDFPIEGKIVSVAEIETYWRKPVRKGVNADRVKLNARLIPCARVRLTGGGDAALIFSFRDSEKKLIGDSISLAVVNGKFTRSGTEEIVINSTAGFTDFADINSLINGDVPPWSLLLSEGEPGQTPSFKDKDKQLAVVRLETQVRQSKED